MHLFNVNCDHTYIKFSTIFVYGAVLRNILLLQGGPKMALFLYANNFVKH